MCNILSAVRLSPTPATEEVTFNKREEKKESGTVAFKARVFTVRAAFARPPCPWKILQAQAQAGLPVAKHGIFPETLSSQTVGGVTTCTWKCRG